MQLTEQLTAIGLNDKQARTYLALLRLGEASVLEISRVAQIKRPTAYIILEELRELGLVTEDASGSTTHFQASNPNQLGQRLASQIEQYQSIKPLLDDLYLQKESAPIISYYSGTEQVSTFFQMFHMEHSTFDIFSADIQKFSQELPAVFSAYTLSSNKKKGAREVVTQNSFHEEYARLHNSNSHEIRILDNQFQLLGNTIIADTTVLLFSLESTPLVTVIESKDLSQTFRSLFEIAWSQARPLPDDVRLRWL